MAGNQLKVGVKEGSGPAPGYLWTVAIIDFVHDEVMKFLTPEQYQHLAMQFKQLATEDDPSHSATSEVDPIEDYFELKEKGGPLGKKNVRIFFGLDHVRRCLVVVGGIKKEAEGQTPAGTRITMRRRWRKYRDGDYGFFNH